MHCDQKIGLSRVAPHKSQCLDDRVIPGRKRRHLGLKETVFESDGFQRRFNISQLRRGRIKDSARTSARKFRTQARGQVQRLAVQRGAGGKKRIAMPSARQTENVSPAKR